VLCCAVLCGVAWFAAPLICRFIPADVDHLREDVESLKSLFFQAGVPMQVRCSGWLVLSTPCGGLGWTLLECHSPSGGAG